MHYQAFIDTFAKSLNRDLSITIDYCELTITVDTNGEIIHITQDSDYPITDLAFQNLVNMSNIDKNCVIILSKHYSAFWRRITSEYGFIKSFSSRHQPYIESVITQFDLRPKFRACKIKPNHMSCCLDIQCESKYLCKVVKRVNTINDAIEMAINVKLVISNIPGVLPKGEVAYAIICDEVIVNTYSKYYNTFIHNLLLNESVYDICGLIKNQSSL